ncbi:hypothetical protein IHV12_06760 [Fictibacillus sp. 7GRE50]|uniref:hypothetical protein n=1 Tax=Fictibacillus sp. 7GRE50 TaxID=2745878 RepID=UPI0018CDA938|nr:hypothetical protein [Fictibacillus sp. 7GRE50]MBH0164613.1 hypothetical protein [Fictibacillus sp. 7GRE50]
MVTFYKIEDNIYGDNLFSKFNHDELKEFITEKNKDYRRDVRNINLPKDNAYSFSLVETFDGQRYPDVHGWWVEIYDSSNMKFVKLNLPYLNSILTNQRPIWVFGLHKYYSLQETTFTYDTVPLD